MKLIQEVECVKSMTFADPFEVKSERVIFIHAFVFEIERKIDVRSFLRATFALMRLFQVVFLFLRNNCKHLRFRLY